MMTTDIGIGIGIPFLLSIFLLFPFSISTNDLLNSVCSKTQNPSFCLKSLSSDPRTAKADLHGLTKVSIDLTRASGQKAFKIMELIAKQETNPKLKERYKLCSKDYGRAIGYVEEAKQSLALFDYQSLSVQASQVMSEIDNCGEEFRTPPVDPPELRRRNRNLYDLASIVYEISLLF